MSKPFSEFDLATQLINDRTWRMREISDLRTAITRADQIGQRVLLRALVAICYAHWEGYVRFRLRNVVVLWPRFDIRLGEGLTSPKKLS